MANIVTAREEHNCQACGRVIQPGEKMKRTMTLTYRFEWVCMDCVEGAKRGYEAAMRLHRDHPEVIPKLTKLYELTRKRQLTLEAIAEVGITEDEKAIFVEYGLIRREE